MTIRSSSEWKLITASRPPGRSISTRRRQRRLERAELVVDRDPQRLEDALGGMPVAEPRGRGDRRLDRVDELARPLERLLRAAGGRSRGRSGGRSAPRRSGGRSARARARSASFTSSRAEYVRGRVHPHVERRVGRVREPALGPVELHARDAEVEQDGVGA